MSGDPAAVLASIASSPDAVGASSAHLFAGLDALAETYAAARPAGLTDRQMALRSPSAVWAAIHAHAEARMAKARVDALIGSAAR